MFEVLIREAAARFGLGDKALPLLQMLLAAMTSKDTGGLAGFLEKFKAAGFGPIIQSWLGGGPAAQPISNSQVETVLGNSGGLLSQITSRLDLGRDNVASALGYLLPNLVGKLTPGGSIPSSLPPEVLSLAAAGQGLLSSAPVAARQAVAPSSGGGFTKWLPWIIVALAALFGLSYFTKERAPEAPPASSSRGGEWGPSGTPAQPAASEAPAAAPAPEPAASPAAVPAPAPATDASAAPAAAADEPTGAGVVGLTVQEMPALKVYFDSDKTEVHADFAAKAADLVAYLKAHPEVKAVISGFNDPTGDAAANAVLSKQRAEAVQAALVAQGVAQDSTLLEKPAETSGTAATNAASRRVEVVLRK